MFDKLFNGSLLSFIMYQIYSTSHIGLLGKVTELKGVKCLEQCLAGTKYTQVLRFSNASLPPLAGKALPSLQPNLLMLFFTLSLLLSYLRYRTSSTVTEILIPNHSIHSPNIRNVFTCYLRGYL